MMMMMMMLRRRVPDDVAYLLVKRQFITAAVSVPIFPFCFNDDALLLVCPATRHKVSYSYYKPLYQQVIAYS